MDCVFCLSDGPMTGEHVFPRWLQPLIGDPDGTPGTHHRVILRRGEAERRQRYPGTPATTTVRSVCEECNTGWMSRLEGEAKSYLGGPVLNRGRTFYSHGQELIAAWFVKTALVAGSKFTPTLPRSFYGGFYADKRASAETRVWLAATNRLDLHYTDYRPFLSSAEPIENPGGPNAFSAVLAAGHVAAVIVSWLEHEPSVDRMEAKFAPRLVELRREGEVPWPPRGDRFDPDGLDELAESILPAADVIAGRATLN